MTSFHYVFCTQLYITFTFPHSPFPIEYGYVCLHMVAVFTCACMLYSTISSFPSMSPDPSPPCGPPLDLQSQLRPIQCLAPHDLQEQLQQLNIRQRSCNTSQSARRALHRATTRVLFLLNSGNSSHMSSFGGPSPAQQPLMAQFMGVHQPIVGASGTDTRIGVRANAHGLYTECECGKCMACDKEGNASHRLLFLSCPVPSSVLL